MAREVYFDPYGSYTRGYDQGTSRQMEVEKGARDARMQDLNFYGMAPLQLDNARLENRFNNAAYPYKVNALGYADIVGKNQAGQSMMDTGRAASWMGNPEPWAAAQGYLYGLNQTRLPDGSIQMTGQDGQPVGAPITTGGITAPWYERKDWWDRNDTYFDQSVAAAGVGVARQNANTSQYSAEASAANYDNQIRVQLAAQEEARRKAAAGQGGIAPWNWIPGFFDTNMPGVTAPNAYNYPQAAPRTPAAMAPQPPQQLPPAYNSTSSASSMFSGPSSDTNIPVPPMQPLTQEQAWAQYQDSLAKTPNHPMPNLTPEQVMAMQRQWELEQGIMPVQQP